MGESRSTDFMDYHEGEPDPNTNVVIEQIIHQTSEFVVYLDSKLQVRWDRNKTEVKKKALASILNRVAHLESIPINHLPQSTQVAFKRMLAEGVARILGTGDVAIANGVLDEAAAFVGARNREVARQWILGVAVIALGVLVCAAAHGWLLRAWWIRELGEPAFQTLFGALLGGLGGIFSIFTRIRSIVVDPSAGRNLHYFETIARLLSAIIGAGLVGLAIKSNFMLGGLQELERGFPLMLLICLFAGTSERLVPSLIERAERESGNGGSEEVGPG